MADKLKQYTVDLGSFCITAKDEDEAYKIAQEMIAEGGWVEIDQIIDDGFVED